jgi:hypothetical protein
VFNVSLNYFTSMDTVGRTLNKRSAKFSITYIPTASTEPSTQNHRRNDRGQDSLFGNALPSRAVTRAKRHDRPREASIDSTVHTIYKADSLGW